MKNAVLPNATPRIFVPVMALCLYAVAGGYFMSLIPLMLTHFNLDKELASWLASSFYGGLLVGAIVAEPLVNRAGHKRAFVLCLAVFIVTIGVMPLVPVAGVWLAARFIAGIAVAGIFVIVESWLLHGDEKGRAKRLGIYMASLYGGTALGQLGIGWVGTQGNAPFMAILSLLIIAVIMLLVTKPEQPEASESEPLSLRKIFAMNKAALIGCVVSGLTLGAIYGLMPLELQHRNIAQSDLSKLMALVVLGGMMVQPIVPWVGRFAGRTLQMALFCLIGGGAIVIAEVFVGLEALGFSLFLLGMAVFALYPIAINLGCANLQCGNIVSATQIMLLSYSVGSVSGPVIANTWMNSSHGLMGYIFVMLLATCIYMLFASIKRGQHMVAGE